MAGVFLRNEVSEEEVELSVTGPLRGTAVAEFNGLLRMLASKDYQVITINTRESEAIYSAAIGTLTMIAPSPEKYTVMSRANLPIGRCVSPAISDGKLYMRMQTGVICYDLTAR